MEPTSRAAAMLEEAGIAFLRDEPLARHTTFKIGGPAALFCRAADAAQLAALLDIAQAAGLPHYILGLGSNILFCDEGYRGLVVRPVFDGIRVDGETVTAQAGAKLGDVCLAARDAGLAGLEFAWGIPGSVGGALYMNAGAFEGEMRDVVAEAEILDDAGARRTLPAAELALGYRSSVFQAKPWVILSVTLRLKKGERREIGRVMDEYLAHRKAKQPLDLPSAGSAFKRPNGAYAGQLIDRCGLRGYRVGNAAIDRKHCGFIVNLGGATCAEVLALAEQVGERVHRETGYVLEKEIRVVGTGCRA